MKIIKVAAAIIKKDDKILIASRKNGEFKGMFEFPGGKVEPGETSKEALIREIQEELDVNIKIDEFFMNVNYQYPTFVLDMDCFICSLVDEQIKLNVHDTIRWISLDEQNINWIPADIQIIEKLQKRGL